MNNLDLLSDFGNLYQAYKDTKRGKKFSSGRLKFETCAFDGVKQIQKLLISQKYDVSDYEEFKIYEPKERIVKACSFKDKIVQHCLCDNILIPRLKNEFIYDNYAGQKNKGTLFALNRLSEQLMTAYNKYGNDCYILKADVTKFFYSIPHQEFQDILEYHFADNDVIWLCNKFIEQDNKIGLPLGNQTSQVFALLYLSGLDHFITGELGIELYGRYMDDFFLIFPSRKYLKQCLSDIKDFLDTLGLELNNKTQIIPFKNGINFCGFHTYVTPDGKIIRKLLNSKKHMAQKKYRKMAKLVAEGKMPYEKFKVSYLSWKKHISHGNCVKLGYEMDKEIEEILKNVNIKSGNITS